MGPIQHLEKNGSKFHLCHLPFATRVTWNKSLHLFGPLSPSPHAQNGIDHVFLMGEKEEGGRERRRKEGKEGRKEGRKEGKKEGKGREGGRERKGRRRGKF